MRLHGFVSSLLALATLACLPLAGFALRVALAANRSLESGRAEPV